MKRKDQMRNNPTTNDKLSDIYTDCCKGKTVYASVKAFNLYLPGFNDCS